MNDRGWQDRKWPVQVQDDRGSQLTSHCGLIPICYNQARGLISPTPRPHRISLSTEQEPLSQQCKCCCALETVTIKNTRLQDDGTTKSLISYKGKSLNNRNFILKYMEKHAQWKILFRGTKWLLSNMPHRGRDNRTVWACAIARTTRPLHCKLASWKSNKTLFFVVRGCETFWNLQKNEGSVWRQMYESGEIVWMGGKISKWKTKRRWWTPEWETT